MSTLTKTAFVCKRRLFILAFLAFFLLLFMAANAYAIGKIVFDSFRDGNYEINNNGYVVWQEG